MKTILEDLRYEIGHGTYINATTLYASINSQLFAKLTIEESNLHISIVSTMCGVLDELIIPLSDHEKVIKETIEYVEFFDT